MHDLIIVGAGPAGLSAALYAGRFGLDTLIFERMSAGGQIILSSEIENYPGFPGGISTSELIERFKKQVVELGLGIETQEVLRIIPSSKSHTIKAEDKIYQTKSIIIASGAQARHLGVAGEEKFIGRGVSYCGTCDGPLFRGKDILAVGGGDRALEEAIFLSAYAQKVYLVHRRQEFRASKILVEKAKAIPKINFIFDSVVVEVCGENKVEQVKLKDVKTNRESTISCQGIFIFVGIEPNTRFLKNVLALDELGFIIIDQQMRTSREGIFACGDCCKKSLYQVVLSLIHI